MIRSPLLVLWLLLTLAACATFTEGPCGWRVNGREVYRNTADFVAFLRTAAPGSITLLEFSGHGDRLMQSMDWYPDLHVVSRMELWEGKFKLLDGTGLEPDPEWHCRLLLALSPQARVFFYGCQTGLHDPSGLVEPALNECIARKFSQAFQVTTVACPEIVYYPQEFPAFDETFFSNPTMPATPGHSTPGGVWNIFERGQWKATFTGLKRPKGPEPRR